MKTFKNPDCTIEFGIGKGAGHDHLCVRINGESLFYAHVIAHPMNLDGKDVSVSFWECVDEMTCLLPQFFGKCTWRFTSKIILGGGLCKSYLYGHRYKSWNMATYR